MWASSSDPVIEETIFNGAGSFDLAEWAKQFYGASAGTPQNTVVGTIPAIVVSITQGKIVKNALLVKRDDEIVQFIFPSTDEKIKELVAIPALILKSIAPIKTSLPAQIKDSSSGILGSAKIGPTCPVVQNPLPDQCKDKPYQAKLRIVDKSQAIVSHFSTDANGLFKVALSPGTYRIESDSDAMLPRLSPTEVVVNAHVFTNISLVFDSGIR